ncbi:uncharacterized protein K452DRAFT_299102 [Aplosporella prunicola CBS 121167]|uniref:Uncharacterized protein n=1 Tax=Aplosporella prunicola CBS 121167 TaxID=1176127 RepID=A0A6A6BEX9_9PEZI|nr:uncharacterized protein K452DRAFT_299102 [Aplosporella prunicola CBS 121167]KAF2141041.1 hypothetical protein K452DRAFT_299102 [Aplosporella prunicola CBS 121167]
MSSRTIFRTCARQLRAAAISTPAFRSYTAGARLQASVRPEPAWRVSPSIPQQQWRSFSAKSTADEKIEEIQELYATARDEFEIAAEETESNTVYAADDRAAAREELDKLKAAYEAVVGGPDKEVGDEVKRRIGQRIRELDNAVVALEESAMEHD